MDDETVFNEIAKASPLAAMDDFDVAVDTFTGIKNKFVEAGWSPQHAEIMVIEIMRGANKDATMTIKNEIGLDIFGKKKKNDE